MTDKEREMVRKIIIYFQKQRDELWKMYVMATNNKILMGLGIDVYQESDDVEEK